MSAPAIEAKSLSALTALASNPPSYPRNPTHVRHEPLVLYIARVPGSRDVFLSPMKPRDRVVTAEDIQSSLYFIHFEQPEDVRFVDPFPGPGYPEQRGESPQRPPVPNAAPPKRKPVPGTLTPAQGFDSRQNSQAPPYPLDPPNHQGPPYPLDPSNHQGPPYPLDQTNLLAPDYHQRRSFDSSWQQENRRPSPPSRRSFEHASASGTSLTLIRRDPGSSAQWNVARITDPRISDVSSVSEAGSRRRTGGPLYLEVNNPGYSKFLHSSTGSLPLQSRQPENSVQFNSQGGGRPLPPVPQASNSGKLDEEEDTFRRRLWMEDSRYGERGPGHRKNNSFDASAGRQSPRRSGEWQRERSSMDLRPALLPSDLGREELYNSVQSSERQSNFRGYVFMSPWNSRCEFVTGAGGASLKCRHVIPGLQGAPPMPMTVSELRFNLPSASRDESKRSSLFHRPRNNRNSSSVSEMDLSLGQEFAGGGFGGRQAKLGKLIIEDEGLKMLDLLVAANMALWWRAYEKI